MRAPLLAVVVFAGASSLLAVALLAPLRAEPATAQPSATVALPSGTESPREGCLLKNGFNICNYGDATMKDTYLRFEPLLGDPLSGFDARCQTFNGGRLCYSPGNPPDWRVQWANLGADAAIARGLTLQPNAEPHPALRDWLIGQMEVGLDTTRVVGRMLTPPLCDRATGWCTQYADKQAFRFPADARSGAEVQRLPLGALSVHPSTEERPSSSASAPSSLLIGVSALLALLGGAVLLSRRGSGQLGATL